MSLVFVDTSVLVAAENLAAGDLHASSLAWLDLLWRTRSGRTSVRTFSSGARCSFSKSWPSGCQ